jgi:hypothetical protein
MFVPPPPVATFQVGQSGRGIVIFRCNFEELSALRDGARAYLDADHDSAAAVAAPPKERVHVESVASRLTGDLSLGTLGELDLLIRGVRAIVDRLRVEMEVTVTASHPADEGAVAAYFEFAHSFSVLSRLVEMDQEMRALVEVMNGRPVTDADLRNFHFPD